jgi:hypothetical protein
MPADPRDDFSGFVGHEGALHGLADPFGLIRRELEDVLREQVPGSEVAAIQMGGAPLVLGIVRKLDDGDGVLAHFGFCLRALVSVSHPGGAESLAVAMTFLFGDVDRPGGQKLRTCFDMHREAQTQFTAEVLRERLLRFRTELSRG